MRSISNQILLALMTLWLLSVLIFAGIRILPGDVAIAILGQGATDEAIAALRHSLGIEGSAWAQYWHWLGGLVQGQLGNSLATGMPIKPALMYRLGNTAALALVTTCIVVPLSIALGVLAVVHEGRTFDRLCNLLVLLLLSLPAFLIGYLLVVCFSVSFEVFPSLSVMTADMGVAEYASAMALPVLTATLAVLPYIMRMTRGTLLDVMQRPYIEMALLKGLPRWKIVIVHAMPNAVGVIIQTVALNIAYMVAGVVVIEQIFVYPGLGQYLVDAVSKRDIPVIQVTALIFGATYIVLNRTADFLSLRTNPRLKREA
jgi:peptide/nickel transport system permease protein